MFSFWVKWVMLDDGVLIYCQIWLGTTFRGAVPNILITFSKREYLWDLAAPLRSRYAAQSRGGDMRLHFTGLSRIDLATLHTHTQPHTSINVTRYPWYLTPLPPTVHFLFSVGFQTMFKLKLKKKKTPLFLTCFFSFSPASAPSTFHNRSSSHPSLHWRW